MNRAASPSRWALIVIAASALALSGCGRKGGLDLPAGVADTPAAQVPTAPEAKADVFNSPSANAAPAAAKGRKRDIFIDPLLD